MEDTDDIEHGNNSKNNITCDEKNHSTCKVTLPAGRDEVGNHSSESILPMKSQDVGIPCEGGDPLQGIDNEPIDTLALEPGEVQVIRKKTPMSIPILCPICLETYKEGETVIVSSNVSCTHGFHQDCILDYLVRQEQGSNPCPCCRQVFLSTETMNDTHKNRVV